MCCPEDNIKTLQLLLYVNLHTEFNLARYQTTLFVEFWFRKTSTTYDKTGVYICILNRYAACSFGFVPLLAASIDYVGWLKNRFLKPAQKLSLVVTFVPSESARPDQIYTRA